MSSSVCGDVFPCSNYFSTYPFNITLNVIKSWNYELEIGYNKLYLSEPATVKKGYFLYLIQGTGRVAIDKAGNSTYSDLQWNPNTKWTKLTELSNWRFILAPINSFTSYQTYFNITHKYLSIGIYNLTLNFLSSNQVFGQIVNVTDCKC